MSLTKIELQDYLKDLGKERDDFPIIFREIFKDPSDGEGVYTGKDSPVFSCYIDTDTNQIIIMSYESELIMEKMRNDTSE